MAAKTIAQRRDEAEKAIKTYGRTSPQSYWPLVVVEVIKAYEKLYAETLALRQIEMFRADEVLSKDAATQKIGV